MDLYYNEGKNVRQIAQEARISFRDIGAILRQMAVNDRLRQQHVWLALLYWQAD